MTIAPAIGLPRLDRASPARWGFPGAVAWWLGITVAACAATPPADSGAEAGSLWLPAIFADRMVLQREMPVPVWGRCEPGAEVSVAVVGGDGQSVAHGRAVAEQTGRWRVNLPALAAGGPWSLVVTAQGPGEATHRKIFADVLIGEVWIACGQSNMGFQVGTSAERDDAAARRGDYPLLRVAKAGRHKPHEVTEPQADVGYGGPVAWQDTTRHNGSCSAVGYYFARDLTAWLGPEVPVGVIELIAILPVQSWADDAVLERVPALSSLRGKPYPSATSRAYMANIVPLAPYAVRGVIYYQGEMNGAGCGTYYHGLKAMMASWRAAWGDPELPFLLVQLPGFLVHQKGKTDLDMDAQAVAAAAGKNRFHPFIGLREAGARVADEDPHAGLAVTIDVGEKLDIHPPRKRPVAERLALQARKLVYGDEALVADGPVAREFRPEGAGFVIGFEGVGSGLVARGDLAGFEVRGPDGTWHEAQATIRGATVEARAAAIPEPEGVRYAWAGFPEATLFNQEGLPARPFRHPTIDLETLQRECEAAR